MISLVHNQKKVLWWAIFLYFIVFSVICIWKYYHFGYNGLDLAIFNQVFYNSAHGHLFDFTIHPQSYLGDHFELIIILLLPFYYLFQHPISLLILQSLGLALAAWPIFLIAKKLLPANYVLLPVMAWLLNPFVQNINLFEFHILPFAIIFILWAFYFYQKNKFPAFLLLTLLALLVREDAALVMAMFSILALLDKKKARWIIWPALLSLGWFIISLKVTSHFAPDGQYKFLYYYAWLGHDLKEIALNALTHPLFVLQHLATWNNFLFTLGLLLPFAALLKPKYLLLGLLIYLQIILGGASNSVIALKLHYSALLLPALFIAFIFTLKDLFGSEVTATSQAGGVLTTPGVLSKIKKFLMKEKAFTLTIILLAIIYACLTLGPLPAAAKKLLSADRNRTISGIKKEFQQSIAQDDKLATTYDFLTPLSSRARLYSLHYAFIGKRQFSETDYYLPSDIDTLLIDFSDFLTYGLQFPHISAWQAYYQNGDDNIRKLLADHDFAVIKLEDSVALLRPGENSDLELYQVRPEFDDIQRRQRLNLDDKITFFGWSRPVIPAAPAPLLPLTLYFQAQKKLETNYQLELILEADDGALYKKYYPLAYGIYPTSEWPAGVMIKINYRFLLPPEFRDKKFLTKIQLLELNGFITLDGLRSVVPQITKIKNLGPAITIPE